MKRNKAVLLLFLGLFILFYATIAQSSKPLCEDAIGFLEDNKWEIDLKDVQESFAVLEPYLDENEFFFCGEIHAVEINEEIKFELLKYLHQNADVRYYVPEAQFSIAHYLNKYVQTGDEYYLDLIIPYWHRSYNVYEFYQKLYEYNQTLPSHERIEVIGFDTTGSFRSIISVIHLLEIIPPEEAPSDIKDPFLKLQEIKDKFMEGREDPEHYYKAQTDYYAGFSDDLFEKILPPVEKIHEFNEENPRLMEVTLQDNYDDFNLILKTIRQGFEGFEIMMQHGNMASYEYREKNSFQNFKEIYPDLNRGKFFGQWGDWHVFQDNYRGFPWLATYLNSEESPLSGGVYSVLLVYAECQRLQGYSLDEGIDFDTDDIRDFRDLDELIKLSDTDLTFFDLQGDQSPFADELYFLGDQASGDMTLGYFESLLLIQNSGHSLSLYGNR